MDVPVSCIVASDVIDLSKNVVVFSKYFGRLISAFFNIKMNVRTGDPSVYLNVTANV